MQDEATASSMMQSRVDSITWIPGIRVKAVLLKITNCYPWKCVRSRCAVKILGSLSRLKLDNITVLPARTSGVM
jgi:hypothetical protein